MAEQSKQPDPSKMATEQSKTTASTGAAAKSATAGNGNGNGGGASAQAGQSATAQQSQGEKTAQAGQQAQSKASGRAGQGGTDAVSLLTQDHREVDELFKQFEAASGRGGKRRIVEQACMMLEIHAMLEEQIFYPACRRAADDDSDLDEAQVEHDTVKLLIADIRQSGGRGDYYDAKVKVLAEYVRHHVKEEEGGDGIFAQAKKDGVDLKALGEQIAREKQRLQQQYESGEEDGADMQQPRLVALRIPSQASEKESSMARANYDDDRERNGGGNRGGSRGGGSTGRERDENGRFMSDDDNNRMSRGRDDDRGGSRGRSSRDDDDRGRQSRSRDDDDRERDGGRRGGWFEIGRAHV